MIYIERYFDQKNLHYQQSAQYDPRFKYAFSFKNAYL
jgi:hypothetical protein